MPGLGEKYELDIEVILKPRAEFQSAAYAASGLPKAPAIVIDGETIVAGKDIGEDELETAIRGRVESS